MRTRARSLSIVTLAASGLLAVACGKPAPVAQVEVLPQSLTLGYPEIRELHLAWGPAAGLDPEAGQPTVFVHLLDRGGKIVRTYDHPFPQPWQEGTPVTDEVKIFQSALASPLLPGHYQLTLGLYGNKSGKRWPLEVAGPDRGRYEYQVAEVEVPPPSAGPRLAFAGHWLASESGGSRQIVTLRWLDGPGALRVEGLAGPGSFWLELKIPAGEGPAEKLVLDDSSNAPSVVVSGSCGGVETGISGAGNHEIEIPVDGVPAGGSCEIRLKPNFHLLKVGLPGGGRRSVALENAAWMPAAPGAPPPAGPMGSEANPGT
ncbi:MAG TPA: hypothetical protein VGR07_04875 [Thermoanaerobaculia bacterium]|nr:hypothetical protein [Thermoanaerobaculia bacterium]